MWSPKSTRLCTRIAATPPARPQRARDARRARHATRTDPTSRPVAAARAARRPSHRRDALAGWHGATASPKRGKGDPGDAGLRRELEVVVVRVVPDAALDRRRQVAAKACSHEPSPVPKSGWSRTIAMPCKPTASRPARLTSTVGADDRVAVRPRPESDRERAGSEQRERDRRRDPARNAAAPAARGAREQAPARDAEPDEQRGGPPRERSHVRGHHEGHRRRATSGDHSRRWLAISAATQARCGRHAEPRPASAAWRGGGAAVRRATTRRRHRRDHHLEPGREVVRVDEGTRDATARDVARR